MSNALKCPCCKRVLFRASLCPTCGCALESVPEGEINPVVSIETKKPEDDYPYGPDYAQSTIDYIQESVEKLEERIIALRQWIDASIKFSNEAPKDPTKNGGSNIG